MTGGVEYGYERKLAALWAEALGVPVERIRRGDNFFEIGGTSRAAARLVVALERRLSVAEFARTPTLAQMADLLERRGPDAGQRK
ncbi:acyl carrier protein [Streptomyces sp. NPDC001351]|uniref:acyl carrier protein n=1 Tax=Streptomyces sp. NPDC001351 TaxID=3364564 RepID=UPI0022503EE9